MHVKGPSKLLVGAKTSGGGRLGSFQPDPMNVRISASQKAFADTHESH
jgi:hypothetical protein